MIFCRTKSALRPLFRFGVPGDNERQGNDPGGQSEHFGKRRDSCRKRIYAQPYSAKPATGSPVYVRPLLRVWIVAITFKGTSIK